MSGPNRLAPTALVEVVRTVRSERADRISPAEALQKAINSVSRQSALRLNIGHYGFPAECLKAHIAANQSD